MATVPKLEPNPEFHNARCLAVLSKGLLLQLDRYRELLPEVLPGIQIVCPSDLDEMRQTIERCHATHELILAIGGDGTINRVLQYIDPEKQVLGILPSGTGNDFASFLGFPSKWRERVGFLSGLSAQPTDFGLAGNIRYINSAGFGIDTETLLERERHSTILRNNYNLLFLLALSRMQCSTVTVTAGDFSETGRFFWLLGMNSSLIGGGTRIAPDARIDDGLLDMLLIRETGKLDMIKLMPAAIRGGHVGSSMVEYRQSESIRIESEDEISIVALDGECYDWKKRELELRCVPSGLRLLR